MKTFQTILTPAFIFWKQKHAEKERRRIKALSEGVTAIYGYYKDCRTAEIVHDPEVNDIPAPEFLSDYRLEISYKEANQAISEGAVTIYLIVKHNGRYVLTYKNALKIPDKHLIRDINGRLCLFWSRWFYKII